jgi:hypothetical protein
MLVVRTADGKPVTSPATAGEVARSAGEGCAHSATPPAHADRSPGTLTPSLSRRRGRGGTTKSEGRPRLR